MKYKDNVKAAICIRDRDRTIRAITVENKGYPGFTGALLIAKYQKKEKVEDLVYFGDIELLGQELYPNSNFNHYIVIEGNKRRIELQDKVTVVKFRDIRVNVDGILKKQFNNSFERYNLEIEVYWATGADYVYIFDVATESWETYAIGYETGRFTDIKVKYRGLINNLVDGEDIDDLTKEEKQYLARQGY